MSLNESLDYAMVVGIVKSQGKPFVSNYDKKISGPIRVFEIKEHGTTWRSNVASDTIRIISRDVKSIPFCLIKSGANNSKQIIKIENPLVAEYLDQALDIAYTHFEPAKESTVTKLIAELASSERIRGVETCERLLREGIQLTAFGRVERCKLDESAGSVLGWIAQPITGKTVISEFKLCEPINNSEHEFILTTLSREELVKQLGESNRTLRIFLFVFGSIGLIAGSLCAYKFIRDYLEKKRQQELMDRARAERERARLERLNRNRQNRQGADGNAVSAQETTSTEDQSTCVICLTNPRELILLDCGHVCLCGDCVLRIPDKRCPICRQIYRRHMPCFIP
jgi:E3 ubiquitin-protein ligase MUL1